MHSATGPGDAVATLPPMRSDGAESQLPPPAPLSIGLDLVYLQADSGGSGTYARELVRAIARVEPQTRLTAWVGTGAADEVTSELSGCDVVRLPVRSTRSVVHIPVELLGLGWAGARRGIQVVHGLAYAAPIVGPVARVVTILDLTWRREPRSTDVLARLMFPFLTRVCAPRCHRIIAISQAAADDLVEGLGFDRNRVSVTPLGVSPPPVASVDGRRGEDILRCGPRGRVLLAVGQVNEHKNLLRLVDAAALLGMPDVVVAVVGRTTKYAQALEERAAQAGVRLRLTGVVPQADLEALYARADLLVMPSRSEGFGLPVLEAMVRGVPVACSAIPPLREVAAGAAELFDPHDVPAIAAACRRVLEDRPHRDELIGRGRRRAGEMAWDTTATLTLAAYRQAIADRLSRANRPER